MEWIQCFFCPLYEIHCAGNMMKGCFVRMPKKKKQKEMSAKKYLAIGIPVMIVLSIIVALLMEILS